MSIEKLEQKIAVDRAMTVRELREGLLRLPEGYNHLPVLFFDRRQKRTYPCVSMMVGCDPGIVANNCVLFSNRAEAVYIPPSQSEKAN